jgi:hypothetical protein
MLLELVERVSLEAVGFLSQTSDIDSIGSMSLYLEPAAVLQRHSSNATLISSSLAECNPVQRNSLPWKPGAKEQLRHVDTPPVNIDVSAIV